MNNFDAEKVAFEENYVLDLQFSIQDKIAAKGLTRDQLSEISGMSKRKISNLMKPGANPNVRTIAKLLYHLQ